MILLADVHLREDSEATVLDQVLPAVGQAALSESKELVILGDLLTFRYKIDARLQNRLIDTLKSLVAWGIHIRIIPGNHDQYEVGGRNALEPLGEIPGIDVYTQPTIDGDGFWLPYRKRPDDISRALEYLDPVQNSSVPPILFTHLGINGALMNDHIRDTDGLPLGVFQKYRAVFLGHYHKRQSIGNSGTICHYVGSPYQTKADESGQEKGYAILSSGSFQYVTTDWGRRYHRFTTSGALDLSQVRPGDDVRVTATSEADVAAIVEQLRKSGIENHVVTPEVEVCGSRLEVPENAGVRAYAHAYVEAQDTPLDKGRLIQTFEELVG